MRPDQGACQFDQVAVASQVAEAEFRHAALLTADELARPAQPQVRLGQREPVGGLREHLQARLRGIGLLFGDEDAVGFVRATADSSGLRWNRRVEVLAPGAYGKDSCSYTAMLPLGNDELLLAYSNFDVADAEGRPCKALQVRRVKVE